MYPAGRAMRRLLMLSQCTSGVRATQCLKLTYQKNGIEPHLFQRLVPPAADQVPPHGRERPPSITADHDVDRVGRVDIITRLKIA